MSDIDYKSLVNQCLEMSSEGCSPEATRRLPSYLRRQNRRRAAFLERKKKLPLADEVTPTTYDNQVCRQGGADLLDKKTASSGQTSATKVETAVDKDCSLNLNPNPTYPWGSDESMESDDSSEYVFDSESNQVNDNGEFKITVPCDECRQSKVTRWWKPPTVWPPDQMRIRCDPCY